MKEPWKNTNCAKIIQLNDVEDIAQKSNHKSCYSFNLARKIILYLTLILAIVYTSYIIWLTYESNEETTMLNEKEFHNLMETLVHDEWKTFTGDTSKANYFGKVQILDRNYQVLWSKILDESGLKNLKDLELPVILKDEKYLRSPTSRSIRSIGNARQTTREKKYLVPHITRFVNCTRFRPVPRGKYLVSPSLYALNACYKHGIRNNELERGIVKNDDGKLRYDLENLLVPCEHVFNVELDEMSDELRDDYYRCKWNGALTLEREKIVEDRFAEKLKAVANNVSNNLLKNPNSTSGGSKKPHGFVECSHLETELYDEVFESPNPVALQHCEKIGVTDEDIEKGVYARSRSIPPLYVGNLYMACKDVFDGHVEYMTKELKEDYRRCKGLGGITKEVQEAMERKFYEVLHEERNTTERNPEKFNLASSTNNPTTTSRIETTNDTTAHPPGDFGNSTTESSDNTVRQSYRNCKPIKNKNFMVCIEVTKVYPASRQ